jgi:hypothetical protein
MKRDYIIYKCKENDNIIRVYAEDGIPDEIYIKTIGETSWTVIGYKDLMNAIEKSKTI